jgi:hypothetical protein
MEPTTAGLSGVMLKLDRAEVHLTELRESIDAAYDSSGPTFSREVDPHTGVHVYRAHGLPAIDPMWSLQAGELIYNLRSALDHLASQLVLLDGREPDRRTQFPVLEGPPVDGQGCAAPVQLRPRVESPGILAALDRSQPYRGADGEIVPYRNSPLWQLAQLNNIDKHRLLLVVVCVLNTDEMYWAGDPDMPTPALKVSIGPVQEGSPVAWFDWGENDPPDAFDPHPALAISLKDAMDLGTRLTPIPVVDVLGSYCHWVRWQIVEEEFRELFPA